MSYCPQGHYLALEDKFCSRCGQEPVTECQNGHPYKGSFDSYGDEERVAYCTECGQPFPWVT